ncbi:MAG TPA: protein kinase [Pyrinomonadaceae bacterium]
MTMTTDRWQQIKEIFHSALEREPEERSAFLDKACVDDASLRKEVKALIAAHEKEGSFIDSPAYEVATDLIADNQDALARGQAFGHYEILYQLGKGGMGEVYLAEDARLGRRVAIKLLPAAFTKDRDRLGRFEQEARAASALNHPNILTIYEIGHTDGLHFIATEFIEGETLRAEISRGRLSLSEVLNVAEQVAFALTASHKARIVHRDIKPENIMVREDGIVKVLDFGLAKLAKQQATSLDATTRALVMTDAGVVMGTSLYMSPEQARGLEVDARTDIWSLGCVLYEMTAGHAPFEGATTSDVIAAILEREPQPLTKLSGDVPVELEWIIRKALRKDKEERYQTARELLADLRSMKQQVDYQPERERTQSPEVNASMPRAQAEGPFETGSVKRATETGDVHPARSTETEALTRKPGQRRGVLAFALLALIAVGIVFAAYKLFGNRQGATNPQPAQNVSEALPELKAAQVTDWSGLDIYPTLSPDGNSIAYSSDHGGSFEIYVKQLAPGGREIQLTSDGQQNVQAAWSPDGRLIAYYSRKRGGIWLVPALGGAARQLTDFGSYPAWSPDGSGIAFQSEAPKDFGPTASTVAPSTIWTVEVAGGSPKQLTQVGKPAGGHGSPSWSPDGKRIAFTASFGNRGEIWSVPAGGGEVKLLSKNGGYDSVYSPDGESIYFAGGSGNSWALFRLRVSPQSGEPLGEPVLIKDSGGTLYRHLRISADGKKIACAALRLANNLSSIAVAPASGEAAGTPVVLTEDTNYRKFFPAFSPDGRKIAYVMLRIGINSDIWVADADGKNPVQLTTDPAPDNFPNWFPEGDRIAFLSTRQGQQTMRAINLHTGREQLLFELDQDMSYQRLSPDGKQFAFNSDKSGAINVWTIPVGGGEQKQLTFDRELAGFPCWSPDGQFIAVEMKRGDNTHVGVVPVGGGDLVQLTSDRGQSFTGNWSPDGTKVVFAGERNGVWNIWWVSVKDRTEKRVTSYTKLNAYVRYPSWSPLGDKIVYEYAETTGNIWMIELK